MKNIFKTIFLLGLIAFTACEIDDPVDDWARVGQQMPHTIWELSSTKVKAGDSLAFKAQYYTNGIEIKQTAVWYDLTEKTTMAATCPIVSFNYSLSIDMSMLSREDQSIINYEHLESLWDSVRKSYVLNEKFPVSNTIRPVEWKNVTDFDQNKFNTLFPDTFASAFKDGLFEKLEMNENLPSYRALLMTAAEFPTEEFDACLDSVKNTNSGVYDKFIKSEKKAELKSKYEAIPFENLIYKSSESTYQVNYLKSYAIGVTFRVFDKEGNEGVSEKFVVEII